MHVIYDNVSFTGGYSFRGRPLTFTPSSITDISQLTGALSHVLPIMISVMVSKWVGDAFGKEGIYPMWIALRSYPWLPPHEYRDKGEEKTTLTVMKPLDELVVIHGIRCTLQDLGNHFIIHLTGPY